MSCTYLYLLQIAMSLIFSTKEKHGYDGRPRVLKHQSDINMLGVLNYIP